MNDFIWFCLKSVQLMTFQVSSFYPEIITKTYESISLEKKEKSSYTNE